jgi:hypothetical protein
MCRCWLLVRLQARSASKADRIAASPHGWLPLLAPRAGILDYWVRGREEHARPAGAMAGMAPRRRSRHDPAPFPPFFLLPPVQTELRHSALPPCGGRLHGLDCAVISTTACGGSMAGSTNHGPQRGAVTAAFSDSCSPQSAALRTSRDISSKTLSRGREPADLSAAAPAPRRCSRSRRGRSTHLPPDRRRGAADPPNCSPAAETTESRRERDTPTRRPGETMKEASRVG